MDTNAASGSCSQADPQEWIGPLPDSRRKDYEKERWSRT